MLTDRSMVLPCWHIGIYFQKKRCWISDVRKLPKAGNINILAVVSRELDCAVYNVWYARLNRASIALIYLATIFFYALDWPILISFGMTVGNRPCHFLGCYKTKKAFIAARYLSILIDIITTRDRDVR